MSDKGYMPTEDHTTKNKFCPFCFVEGVKQEMLFHHSMVSHSIYDKETGAGIYARDESMKCPRCKFFCTFGVPITKQEYESYISQHGGRFEFSKPERLDYHDVIVKRLAKLGYMDIVEE